MRSAGRTGGRDGGYGAKVARRLGFGVPGGAEKNDDGGKLHPDEQTDDRGEAAVHDAVRYAANVTAEEDIYQPPEQGSDDCAGNHVANAIFLGASGAVDHDERGERKGE